MYSHQHSPRSATAAKIAPKLPRRNANDARYVRVRTDGTGRPGVYYVGSPTEITMYIGGGILGTVLLVLLIVYLVRRV